MIYFVQSSGSLNIKIGWTAKEDVQERVRDHQTSHDSRLVLLGWCQGSRSGEQELHRQFAEARVAGGGEEWFRPVPELLQLILAKTAYGLAAKAAEEAVARLYDEQREKQRIETEDDLAEKLAAELRRAGIRIELHLLMEGDEEEDVQLRVEPKNELYTLFRDRIRRHDWALARLARKEGWVKRVPKPAPPFTPGEQVSHAKYGDGQVVELSGWGAMQKVRVRFRTAGERTFFIERCESLHRLEAKQ